LPAESRAAADRPTAALDVLARALAPDLRRLGALYGLSRYDDLARRLDAICARYAHAALGALGVPVVAGEPISTELVLSRCKASPHHARLVARLLEMLGEDGHLDGWDGRCGTWRSAPNAAPEELSALLEAYPTCENEMRLLRAAGEALPRVLRGETSALAVLFPSGSTELVEGVYEDSPFSRYYNGILERALGRLFQDAPVESLRCLEIGAGTGATTAHVLPRLAGKLREYVFSDVSPLFLARAGSKFGKPSFLRTTVFDVEQDAEAQGIHRGEYDCVLAANVLHTTEDLGRAVRTALGLLKPGGYLLVLEGTRKQRLLDLVFGLTEGWWKFQDVELRPDYPLIDANTWLRICSEAGAVSAVVLPPQNGAASAQSVIIARAGETAVQARVVSAARDELEATSSVAPAAPWPKPQPSSHGTRGAAQALLQAYLAECIKSQPHEIELDKNFSDMGLDSLLAVELVGRLQKQLGITLNVTALFEYPNCRALGDHLASRHEQAILRTFNGNGVIARRDRAQHAPPPPAPVSSAAGLAPHARARVTEQLGDDAIAIIGMACRFPRAPSLELFWRLLVSGGDAVSEIPRERWDVSCVKASRYGAFLDGLALFDPLFFEISPREARLIDPQQRTFMEVAWESLEHAGYGAMMGGEVGVFVGATNADYFERIREHLSLEDYAAGLGNKNCIIPNRFSYFMNFRGPSLTVDTACSSSLFALHLACESLRRGECSLAVAGGVNALLSPTYYSALHRMGVQAPDGRCKAFDARADGFASGEGAGAVVLKPLRAALRDRDTVWAIVRGSAVNHGGRSNGLAAPNPAAHADVIERAYRNAGLSPETISYVEAHGTGTALGDPIEVDGLTRAFARFTGQKRFCALGSVKTNIAHLEPAAGIASIIKVVLGMKNRTLPPSLHYRRANPRIEFERTPFFVNADLTEWRSGRRLAGVSSFGMGGANAHVILEEGSEPSSAADDGRPSCLALSTKSPGALRDLVTAYVEALSATPRLSCADVCVTAGLGRTHFNHRVAIVARGVDEFASKLRALSASADWSLVTSDGIYVGKANLGSSNGRDAHAKAADAHAVARQYAAGAAADLAGFYGDVPASRVALPTYPFQRQSYWVELEPRAAERYAVHSRKSAIVRSKQHPFRNTR
jgi:polyketide synthase PksM